MTLNFIGTKLGMTQIFDDLGNKIAVTLLKINPCYITAIKTTELHGYNAIQLGYTQTSEKQTRKNLKKPILVYLEKNNLPIVNYFKEFKINSGTEYFLGEQIKIDSILPKSTVKITGFSIGRGNAGNIKKHHFNRGPMSHGSKSKRLQGSLGAGTTPGRTFPGKKMPGRMGGTKCTLTGLKMVFFDKELNILAIKGALPGKKNNIITLTVN
jgi:large subunit ribosomal protein L3